MKSLEDLASQAESAIKAHASSAAVFVKATDNLVGLTKQRADLKTAAVLRLVNDRKLTLTRAEDLAQLDPQYAMYKERVAGAERARMTAKHETRNALLSAKLAVALVRATIAAGV